jgi:HEAT repeat protein
MMTTTRADEDARVAAILNERAGISVKSVFDLVNSKAAYPQAVPVLLECLPGIREKWIKEGVVRALSVKEARGKADAALVREFKAIAPDDREHQSLKWAIGNALSTVATDNVANDLYELAQDKGHGKAREMVVVALGNLSDPGAVEVLMNLLDDEEVCGHAIIAIAKLKARQAVPKIQRLTKHPKPWVRKEAEKAISKLTR